MEHSIRQRIARRCPLPAWLQRLGLVGFLFFLIKGMLWITLPGILLLLEF